MGGCKTISNQIEPHRISSIDGPW